MSGESRLRRGSARRTQWSQSTGGVEQLEVRTLMSASPIGGVGNNVQNPTWGTAGIDLLRKAMAQYADGTSAVAGANRPSARVISNAVADQAGQDIISDRQLSAMIYAWGQFIDHDFDLTPTGTSERLSIAVPKGDPYFDPLGTGTQSINTTRSIYDAATGTTSPRQQINTVTAFIDGSMVYGSDAATAASLRTFLGGLMKTSAGNLLPEDPNSPAGNPTGTMFIAGDVRVNENAELIAMQTLFLREHNYWARQFAAQNPSLTDEQLYQKAREQVIFEIQAITYNEWLPSLLGANALPRYTGYKPNVNPGIANEFSTAGFRFGHSLLGDDVEFLDNNGQEVHEEVSLAEAFFNPDLVRETGIDSILKYLASDPSSEVDTKVVDSVRNFLFGPPGAGGLDLASLNIQRGRDHGLADYNTVRAAYGLPKVRSFAQITSDVNLQNQLKSLYGTVDNIDLWVGALAENHVAGASVGQTLKAIITDQFVRLRDGDRFWYQNQLKGPALQAMDRTTLADVLRRNTTNTNLQSNVFFFRAEISGTVNSVPAGAPNGPVRLPPRPQPLANATVQLIDAESGEVIATTKTDARGTYKFTVADGVRTGGYLVQVLKNDGSVAASSASLSITRGDQNVRGIDFTLTVGATIPVKPPAMPPSNPPPGRPHTADQQTSNLVAGVTTSSADGVASSTDSTTAAESSSFADDSSHRPSLPAFLFRLPPNVEAALGSPEFVHWLRQLG